MTAQPISLAGVITFAAVPAVAVVVGGLADAIRTPGPKVQSAV